MKLLSDNGVSRVWKDGKYVFKRQPKHLTQNEIWCLEEMYPTGYVPVAQQVEIDMIRMHHVPRYGGQVSLEFLTRHAEQILGCLETVGIRHGDLTEYAVILSKPYGVPVIIDFAESRLACDPRPDKRPEGDRYWLMKTMRRLSESTQ